MKMIYQKSSYLLIASFAIGSASCTFKFDVTSQKTALENQVLGSYQQLEDDLVLVGTVRGPQDGRKVDAVALAKQNQKFNLDDIEELKDAQVLGEANDGRLLLVPADAVKGIAISQEQMTLAKMIIGEENQDRATVWKDIISNNRNLTAGDEPAVRRTFAKQKRDEAQSGQWLQDESGQWIRKLQE